MITNGTVKYGETVKTGDFENKRVDVELSFNVPEGGDTHAIIQHTGNVARAQADIMLGRKTAPGVAQATVDEVVAKTAAKAPKAPKAPAKEPHAAEEAALKADLTANSAASVEEPTPVPAILKGKMLDPATGKAVAAQNAAAVVEDDISDMLGAGAPKEITDKELTDATQKCQAANKNSPAIRVALKTVGVVSPPGRIIDIAQDKRQEYLDELLKIKPLA